MRPKFSIRFVSMAVAITPAVLMFVALTIASLQNTESIQEKHLNDTVGQMQTLLSDTAEFALATGNRSYIQRVIDKQTERPDILSIEIRDIKDAVFARSHQDFTNELNQVIQYRSSDIIQAPSLIEDDLFEDLNRSTQSPSASTIGKLIIGLDVSYIQSQRQQQVQAYVFLAIGAFVVALLLAYVVSRLQMDPLAKALKAVRDLRQGELQPSPPAQTSIKEIDHLSLDIHGLSQQLFEAEENRNRARTEREKYIQQITDSREEADRANLAKTRFLATVSHELRTPLNTILGMVQILEETSLTPVQHNYLGLASSQTLLLNALVKDILDFAQIEYGQLKLHYGSCTTDEVIEQLFNSYSLLADEKNIELTLEKNSPQTDFERPVYTDATRLKQIIGNLLHNAIKFTLQGQINFVVNLHLIDNDTFNLHVSIKDTGIGIAEDQLDTIFDLFQQADNSPTKHFEGTGLGLTIASELAKLMGATISVESTLGSGSTFSVNIPIRVQEQQRIEEPSTPTSRIPVTTQRSETASHKVLLVEDNRGNQAVIQGLLGLQNIDVDILDNAELALTKLGTSHYDLILLDCFMPNMDGFTLCKELRKSGISQNTPIIGLSADAQDSTRERCFDSGMDDFIAKPISKFELYRKIEHYFSMKQQTETMLTRLGQSSDDDPIEP